MSKKRVIVVGGGAAGLIAAGQAALHGAEVLLLEKKLRSGRKLRITGKGRCNLTNSAELADFLTHFPSGNKFLRNAFARFFSHDLLAFFGSLGIATETERGGRVFPIDNDAVMVSEILDKWVRKCGVQIRTEARVESILTENKSVTGVQVAPKGRASLQVPFPAKSRTPKEKARLYRAETIILTTGGMSYPATGSTGDGYKLAAELGHTVVPPRPSLVPLETQGDTAGKLEGLSLKNVNAALYSEGKKVDERFGEMLFNSSGLTGPIILSLSRTAVDLLKDGKEVIISIDLKPALDFTKLEARLLRDFGQYGTRQLDNILKGLLPKRLIDVCLKQGRLEGSKPGSQISSEERKRLLHWLKDFRFKVTGDRGYSEAIITAGGIRTKEIDPKTMESRLIKGLYFAGEVIDIDADTGGYNLQAAFSTGWLAGLSAASPRI